MRRSHWDMVIVQIGLLAQFPKLTEAGLILIEHYFYNEPEVSQRANDAANDYATVHEKFMDF